MTLNSRDDETFYEILKVDPRATVTEIVAAYHTARNTFSRDSIATYSLFTAEDTQNILAKLEQAYHTLTNIEKKAEYDKWLALQEDGQPAPPAMTELEIKKNAQRSPQGPQAPQSAPEAAAPLVAVPVPDTIDGIFLRECREKRSLSLDDVARITKISPKFLRAIEGDDPKGLPARVYLQGFVKNLACLYKLDPQHVLKAYLQHFQAQEPPTL